MTKFIRIQICDSDHTHDELINIEDISRVSLELRVLFLRTPHVNGNYNHNITQESVDKLLKVLDVVGEEE